MKKNYFTFGILALMTASVITSCSTGEGNEEKYESKKNDITVAQAKKMLSELTSAKSEDKEKVISNFAKKNKIEINDSEVLAKTTLDTYSPEQLASVIPVYGGRTGILPTYDIPGSLITRRVEWVVVENAMGLWRVRSFEDIRHTLNMIQQATHFGTRFEGVTAGLLAWEEFNASGNIQMISGNTQVLSIVQGTIHVIGYWDVPVDNYCVFSIY